jgi:nucleoside-diphosphate-sugar epimerase
VKALVTGSAGFVGRHMTAGLTRRGWEVTAVDIQPADFGWQADMLTWLRGDHNRYDLVVHAAARSPHRLAIDGDPGMHPYNVMLDAAMFDWAIRTRQYRVLYLSSCAAIDGPVDDYAATKLMGERLAAAARRADIPVTVVRPFSGYGEDQAVDFPFRAFIERARRGDDPFEIWGDGQQVRDWIHIDDVVNGALAVAESGAEDAVSLCTGRGVSMADLARYICLEAGYSAPPEFKLLGGPHVGVAYRVGDPRVLHRYYTPQVSLEDGVRRALGVASGAR